MRRPLAGGALQRAQLGLASWPRHSPAAGLRQAHLTSLCLSFPTCHRRLVPPFVVMIRQVPTIPAPASSICPPEGCLNQGPQHWGAQG